MAIFQMRLIRKIEQLLDEWDALYKAEEEDYDSRDKGHSLGSAAGDYHDSQEQRESREDDES